MTRAKSLAPLAILGLLFLIPAFTQDSYYLYLIYNFFIWAVVAVSLIVNIRTGIFNFASAAFMGIGAYTTAILVVKVGVSFWLTLLIGPLVGAVVAVLIGIPMLRLKGMYFVLVTALFCQIFILTIVSLSEQTGGWFGIAGIYAPTLFGIDLSEQVIIWFWFSCLCPSSSSTASGTLILGRYTPTWVKTKHWHKAWVSRLPCTKFNRLQSPRFSRVWPAAFLQPLHPILSRECSVSLPR